MKYYHYYGVWYGIMDGHTDRIRRQPMAMRNFLLLRSTGFAHLESRYTGRTLRICQTTVQINRLHLPTFIPMTCRLWNGLQGNSKSALCLLTPSPCPNELDGKCASADRHLHRATTTTE